MRKYNKIQIQNYLNKISMVLILPKDMKYS